MALAVHSSGTTALARVRQGATSSLLLSPYRGLTRPLNLPSCSEPLLGAHTPCANAPALAVARGQLHVACAGRRDGRPSSGKKPTGGFNMEFNGTRLEVSQDNLWQLALPVALLVGLAAFIGPLVIGVAVSAVAVGAAMSVGALAMSLMWIPMLMMAGTLFFTLFLPFGFFATFGLGLFLPKLMSLAYAFMLRWLMRVMLLQGIAAAGLGLGFVVIKQLLPQPTANATLNNSSNSSAGSTFRFSQQDGPVVPADSKSVDSVDEEVLRQEAELDDFDRLLRQREREKFRAEAAERQRRSGY